MTSVAKEANPVASLIVAIINVFLFIVIFATYQEMRKQTKLNFKPVLTFAELQFFMYVNSKGDVVIMKDDYVPKQYPIVPFNDTKHERFDLRILNAGNGNALDIVINAKPAVNEIKKKLESLTNADKMVIDVSDKKINIGNDGYSFMSQVERPYHTPAPLIPMREKSDSEYLFPIPEYVFLTYAVYCRCGLIKANSTVRHKILELDISYRDIEDNTYKEQYKLELFSEWVESNQALLQERNQSTNNIICKYECYAKIVNSSNKE